MSRRPLRVFFQRLFAGRARERGVASAILFRVRGSARGVARGAARTELFRVRGSARGVASVEAVVLLPILILLFVGILYLRDLLVGVQQAENQARSCAWLYSENGCTSVPSGCEGLVGPGTSHVEVDSTLTRTLDEGARRAIEAGDASGFVETVLGSILGPALDEAFGNSLEGRGWVEVKRPPLLGGDRQVLSPRFQLSCNLTARTPGQVAMESWGIFQP